jgi:peptidoglycan/xylan/chitin deacetylase (PgdA/CDA1 family)
MTFDDGYEDFFFEVFPHLERFELKPIIFLPAKLIGLTNMWDLPHGAPSRKLLSLNQIRELHRHGVGFGSHTLTHPALTRLSDHELRREVEDSKAQLEDLLGSEISCFAYPYGDLDQRVRSAVGQAGYRFAFSTKAGLNFWDDLLTVKRLEVNDHDSVLELALMLFTGLSTRENIARPIKARVRLRCRGVWKWLAARHGNPAK